MPTPHFDLIERMALAHHRMRVQQGYARQPWHKLEQRVREEYRAAMTAAFNSLVKGH